MSITLPDSATRALLALLLSFSFSGALAAGPPEWLLGQWTLNSELTHEQAPKESGGGFDSIGAMPSVSVSGIPIPFPGGSSGAPVGGNAADPKVLRCDAMFIEMHDGKVHFNYSGAGEETMKPGNDQGRKTKWSSSKLSQNYATSSRKVRKTYELKRDGTLLVKVKLSPNRGKSVTHVRIFDRNEPNPT